LGKTTTKWRVKLKEVNKRNEIERKQIKEECLWEERKMETLSYNNHSGGNDNG
jgi:hypothetical protein